MPGRRRVRRSPAPRRQTGWLNHSLNEQTLTSGGVTRSDILDGLPADERSDVGSILSVSFQGSFGLSTANAEAHGRWGLGIATLDAFAGSDTPEPLADHQFGWYWNEGFALDDPNVEFRNFRGRTRTERKLPSRSHTMFFAITSSGLSAGTLKWGLNFRILYSHK